VRKIPVDAGFPCPNRDGTLGTLGCTFCLEESYVPVWQDHGIRQQVQTAKARLRARGVDAPLAVYLQPRTNTHGSLSRLREAFEAALDDPDVVALFVGTRPDCVDAEKLSLLRECAAGREVWVEYGVQTARDATLTLLGRNHTFADFARAAALTADAGLKTLAHVILGLPGEGPEDEARTASRLAAVGVDGIKLHNLYVPRGTAIEQDFRAGRLRVLGMAEYAERVVAFLEQTPKGVVVHRMMSDPAPEFLVAPKPYWGKNRFLDRVDAIFEARGSAQGRPRG